MPGTTPQGYPYATPTDKRINWPATSQALAEKLDSTSNRIQAGSQPAVVGSSGEIMVTFPVPFAAPPTVVVSHAAAAGRDPAGQLYVGDSAPYAPTNTGFGCIGLKPGATHRINWIAVGPTT